MSRTEQIAATAEAAVAGWASVSAGDREQVAARAALSPVIHPLKSGGYLVDVGDAYPTWCADMASVRHLTLRLALGASRPLEDRF